MNRRRPLRRPALLPLGRIFHYAPDDPPAGGGAGDPPKKEPDKKEKKEADAKKLELTEDELQAKVDAAVARERKKHADDKEKEKADADRKKAEEEGQWQKLAEGEQAKREKAERGMADAERRAQLAEVNVQLRDHLAAKHQDYLANAADIMLHVEKSLAADAKPADVRKLIDDETKAFIERTPRGRVTPPPPAPPGRPAPSGTKEPAGANGNERRIAAGMSAHF